MLHVEKHSLQLDACNLVCMDRQLCRQALEIYMQDLEHDMLVLVHDMLALEHDMLALEHGMQVLEHGMQVLEHDMLVLEYGMQVYGGQIFLQVIHHEQVWGNQRLDGHNV